MVTGRFDEIQVVGMDSEVIVRGFLRIVEERKEPEIDVEVEA
jgi:hypothetical protein